MSFSQQNYFFANFLSLDNTVDIFDTYMAHAHGYKYK